MKRSRYLIHAAALMLAIVLVIPAVAHAEKTIGVIMTGDMAYYREIHDAFMKVVSARSDIKVVLQTPAPEPMSWTNAARKLVVLGSDAIVSYGAPATLTVMKETSTIPILFAGVYDPQAMQISGKNATGISSKVDLGELLKEFKSISDFSTLGVLFSKAEKDTILQVREIKKLEGSYGFKTVLITSAQKDELAEKFGGINALMFTTSCSTMCTLGEVMAHSFKNKLATASSIGGGENDGILFTKKASPEEQGQTVAGMALKVLDNGTSPSSMPIIQPSKIETIVNLKAASRIGVTVPKSVMDGATKVIQ